MPGAALGQRGNQGTSAAPGPGTATAKRAPLLRAAAGSSPKPQPRALLRGRRQHNLHPPEPGIDLQNDTKASPHSAAGAGAARQPAPSNCYYVQHGGRRGGHRAALHSEPLARLPRRPAELQRRHCRRVADPDTHLREADATRPSPQPRDAGLSLAAAHAQPGCGGGRAARPRPPPGGGKRREGARRSSQPSTSGRGRTHPPLPWGCSFNKTSPVCFQCSILFSFEQPVPLPAPVSPGAYNSTARQPCRPPAVSYSGSAPLPEGRGCSSPRSSGRQRHPARPQSSQTHPSLPPAFFQHWERPLFGGQPSSSAVGAVLSTAGPSFLLCRPKARAAHARLVNNPIARRYRLHSAAPGSCVWLPRNNLDKIRLHS